jgi:hypothetical protein
MVRNESADEVIGFETLLTEYDAAERQDHVRQLAEQQQEESDFRRLLEEYEKEFRLWRKKQVTAAEDFNLVELLGIVHDENRHSNVLAWLLDGDIYSATHSQGDLGFRTFLKEVSLPSHYADGTYEVGREVQAEESRIDIEILAQKRFVIHIEAKIGSGEGTAQLEREWRDLRRKAETCGVSKGHIHAFFLTPAGEKPSHDDFRPISWFQIAHIFEEFARDARAESVRWFANHYAQALRKYVVQD